MPGTSGNAARSVFHNPAFRSRIAMAIFEPHRTLQNPGGQAVRGRIRGLGFRFRRLDWAVVDTQWAKRRPWEALEISVVCLSPQHGAALGGSFRGSRSVPYIRADRRNGSLCRGEFYYEARCQIARGSTLSGERTKYPAWFARLRKPISLALLKAFQQWTGLYWLRSTRPTSGISA